jgi:hypothetical protein
MIIANDDNKILDQCECPQIERKEKDYFVF